LPSPGILISETYWKLLKLLLKEPSRESVGGIGSAMVQAGTHAIAQGVLGMVQGDKFLSTAAGGFLEA